MVKSKAYAIETWQQKLKNQTWQQQNQKIQLISNYQSNGIIFFWVGQSTSIVLLIYVRAQFGSQAQKVVESRVKEPNTMNW